MGEKPIQVRAPESQARNLSVCLLFAIVSGFEVIAVLVVAGMIVVPLVVTIKKILDTPSHAPTLLVIASLLLVLLAAFLLCASYVMAWCAWYRLRWIFHAPSGGWPHLYGCRGGWAAATLVRSIAYLTVNLMAGAMLVAVFAAIVLISIACIAAPFVVVGMGQWMDIGPVRIETPMQATFSAALGVVGFFLLIGGAWPLARLQSRIILAMLVDPENDFRSRLSEAQAAGARIIDAFDAERRRIERDLHDGIQPALVSLLMSLGLMRIHQLESEELDASLANAQAVAKDLLEQTRMLIRGTFPDALLGAGLVAALTDLAVSSAVPVALRYEDDLPLPSHLATTLYFCVAELVTNASKHANPEKVTVTIHSDRKKVWIEVVDDGVGGADMSRPGLTGVADRLRLVSGRVEINSPPGGPTVAVVTVPRKEKT